MPHVETLTRTTADRLAELRMELAGEPAVQAQREERAAMAAALALNLPLMHRIGECDRLGTQVRNGAALELVSGTGSKTRQTVGTEGCLFFWLGLSAFTSPPLLLVIDPAAEAEWLDTLGAPWDTAGVPNGSTLGYRVDGEAAARLVARYSLPYPEYRDYLASVLTHCFADPLYYLEGRTPLQYPGHVRPPSDAETVETPRLPTQTFEVRRLHSAQVDSFVIAVVVDETWFAHEARSRTLRQLKDWTTRLKVPWVIPERGEGLRHAGMKYLRSYLAQRGLVL